MIRLNGPARAIALDVLRVSSLQTGAYVSHFRGRGMEFDESRPYQPGDDPRSIDWRVTARSTTAYTKLFREERERPVLVVVDLRANMHLGRQAALRYVHELAGHPDWDNKVRAADIDGAAPMTQAMAALRRVARPGSLVVILSDFQDFDRSGQSYLSGVARHNEVLAVFINDPLERRLPPPGQYRLVSDDHELAIDTAAKAARRDYEKAFTARAGELEAFCQRYGVHLMPMSTEDDPVAALQTALGRRTR